MQFFILEPLYNGFSSFDAGLKTPSSYFGAGFLINLLSEIKIKKHYHKPLLYIGQMKCKFQKNKVIWQ